VSPPYPLTAVVGLADLRLALLLNAVAPAIGGVLVRGEKGTAKSTVVRALAALLPAIAVVPDCRFSCSPAAPDPACPDGPHEASPPPEAVPVTRPALLVGLPVGAVVRPARLVELPVGATEDRLIGALDLQRALTEGVKAYEPGLLAAAHRGVLYVDEVNLLHDHLVDLLLDAAAMGVAHVERDGVSVRHAARFLLVGTMNPEEGELRPQLLDRFGLTVEVAAPREPGPRAEVVRRRLRYEADPVGFAATWAGAEAELAARIAAAQELLPAVALPDRELVRIAHVCAAFEVEGLRADLVIARTAVAHAAWHGRTEAGPEDVEAAARLALPHRRRRDPFEQPGLDDQRLAQALEEAADALARDGGTADPPDGTAPPSDTSPPGTAPPSDTDPVGTAPPGDTARDATEPPDGDRPDPEPDGDGPGSGPGAGPDTVPPGPVRTGTAPAAAPRPAGAPTPAGRPRLLAVPGLGAGTAGRRSPAYTRTGRTVGARTPTGRPAALHLAATVHAAAPHQRIRGRGTGPLILTPPDIRVPVRQGREANLVLFAVDASGSMAARARMGAVTGAVLALLRDAYQRRDKVGLISFRGTGAHLVLAPTSSMDVGAAALRDLPTGGRTPLAAGLTTAAAVLRAERRRDPQRRALFVLVTDGRATSGGADPVAAALAAARTLVADGVASVVVDCEHGPVRLGLARTVAGALDARYLALAELSAPGLHAIARGRAA
jgi:magnesium chelatase subunit D